MYLGEGGCRVRHSRCHKVELIFTFCCAQNSISLTTLPRLRSCETGEAEGLEWMEQLGLVDGGLVEIGKKGGQKKGSGRHGRGNDICGMGCFPNWHEGLNSGGFRGGRADSGPPLGDGLMLSLTVGLLLTMWQRYCTEYYGNTKFVFGRGSAPEPAGGAHSAPPDPLAGLRGPLLLRGGDRRERESGRGEDGKRMGRKGPAPLTQILGSAPGLNAPRSHAVRGEKALMKSGGAIEHVCTAGICVGNWNGCLVGGEGWTSSSAGGLRQWRSDDVEVRASDHVATAEVWFELNGNGNENSRKRNCVTVSE